MRSPTRRTAGDPHRRWAARWRRARARRIPSDEELATALSLWALIELSSVQGEVGVQAQAEIAKLGIDVKAKYLDIKKLVFAKFHSVQLDPEDLLQEVMVAILKRNGTPSAYDPQKAAFSHYVFMIAQNALRNALEKQKRWGREGGVGGGECPDMMDSSDPIGAFEHVQASPRIAHGRVLDRSCLTPGRGVFN